MSTSSSGILLLFPSRDSASATSQLPSDSRRNLVDGLFGDLETGPPPVWWIVAGTAEKIGSKSGKGTDLNRVDVEELVQGRTPQTCSESHHLRGRIRRRPQSMSSEVEAMSVRQDPP